MDPHRTVTYAHAAMEYESHPLPSLASMTGDRLPICLYDSLNHCTDWRGKLPVAVLTRSVGIAVRSDLETDADAGICCR